ncbi:MAG TPA: shikimate dehydrogenase, partial [Bacillota bacterium]
MSKRYYLFGRPVAASLSPAMHNAALRALGLEGEYTAVDASPEEFIKTASGLITRPDFGGANVTIPHKRAAIGLCVSLSPDAEAAGAVNTLVARAATGQGVTGH